MANRRVADISTQLARPLQATAKDCKSSGIGNDHFGNEPPFGRPERNIRFVAFSPAKILECNLVKQTSRLSRCAAKQPHQSLGRVDFHDGRQRSKPAAQQCDRSTEGKHRKQHSRQERLRRSATVWTQPDQDRAQQQSKCHDAGNNPQKGPASVQCTGAAFNRFVCGRKLGEGAHRDILWQVSATSITKVAAVWPTTGNAAAFVYPSHQALRCARGRVYGRSLASI